MTGPGETAAEQDERPEGSARHAARDGDGLHPLIDLTRDPTPGVPDHAASGEDE
ncbi:MAG: hypothetical protein ACRDZY_22005 [Acidimicrobiales bacterium]